MSFLGNALLILALLVAIYSIASALLDSRKNKYGFPTNARIGVFAVAGMVTLAVALLLISLLTHNFALKYVADNSSLETPPIYLITGLWAGNAGALLFWGWIVALSGAILLWRGNRTNKELLPNALSVVLFTEVFFLILVLIQSPFQGLSPIPADGAGLLPPNQNVGMIFHPPLLLAGYALFVVPFAMAIASLFNRDSDEVWLVTAKRWAIAGWLLLGLGNVLGMWWAYTDLSFFGYWAWDPVENAGLMPWLLMTAFLHSSMMYLRRGMFKAWTFILAIAAFWMVIFGAFLERSNVKDLVGHTFGQSPMTGVFIAFLVITFIGSLWLLIARRMYIKSREGDDALVSGTGTFLGLNLLFIIAFLFILVGTLLSLFTNFTPAKSYFNIVSLPIFLLLILLSGFCVLVGWKKPDLAKVNRQLLWPAGGAVLLLIILVIFHVTVWYVVVPFLILAMVFITTIMKWGGDVAARMRGKKEGFLPAFGRLFMANRSRYGGYIVHIAILVLALGIIGSSAYKSQVEQQLKVGDSLTLGGYTLKYNGLDSSTTQKSENVFWLTATANMDLSHDGKSLGTIHPKEILQFVMSGGTVVEAPTVVSNKVSIRSNLGEDYYVVFEDFDGNTNDILVRVLTIPLVQWIWIGGILLLVGGLVSFSAPSRKPSVEEKE